MKANASLFPVFVSGSGRADETRASMAISALLPGLNNRNHPLSGDFLILPGKPVMSPTRRLVVLVPDNELDENDLARKVWRLAAPAALNVLFLSLSKDPVAEPYLRRRLATLAALTSDKQVRASARLVSERKWAKAVEIIWNPGDLLVCYARPINPSRGFQRGRPGLQLARELNAPVYCLTELKLGPALGRNWVKECLLWSVALVLLVAFGWLQFQVDRATDGWSSTLTLFLIVFVEIGIIYLLNDLIG
jgi:hypothetical protein